MREQHCPQSHALPTDPVCEELSYCRCKRRAMPVYIAESKTPHKLPRLLTVDRNPQESKLVSPIPY